ncbi:MAG: response regulator [Candidatus Thorarchaeota archaeon]|nr:response regulator [Candidatus Thorarchaeota archaeon]
MTVNILIIDDDPAITKILTILIKRQVPNAKIIIAHDCMTGIQAIDKMKTGRIRKKRIVPDLVLVDARLPVIDGFQCCERLLDLGVSRMVMMTATLTPDLVPKVITAGAETVFKKSAGLKSIATATAAIVNAIEQEKEELAAEKSKRFR